MRTKTANTKPGAVVTVSRVVVEALSANEKAQAAVDKFCARADSEVKPDDDETLAALCEAEIKTLFALLDLKPISAADVALVVGYVAKKGAGERGYIFPETDDGGYCELLLRAVARWLSDLSGFNV